MLYDYDSTRYGKKNSKKITCNTNKIKYDLTSILKYKISKLIKITGIFFC